jgi:hypothetical protein
VSPDHLAEINAQAQEHIERLREATQSAHERLNAGLPKPGLPVRAPAPEPVVRMTDFDAWEEPLT